MEPQLGKANLHITRLARPYMIWLSLTTLILTASTLPLAHFTPVTLSFLLYFGYTRHAPSLGSFHKLSPVWNVLCQGCTTSSLTPFRLLFRHPSAGFPMTLLKMSMYPTPHTLPQLYFCSNLHHHQSPYFTHLSPSLECQLFEGRDLSLFHSLWLRSLLHV